MPAGINCRFGRVRPFVNIRLTIGKKKYAGVEEEMQSVLTASESLREKFAELVDTDTNAFNKVMEAFSLPKETEDQKALRKAAIRFRSGSRPSVRRP